ncbi:hypothetical protein BGZ46_007370 [Entomortierella lignicola]|nr:hypothetical protein BGZ46_007370 [Entomortierella lignicola]
MFTPRKNRNIRKKVEVENDEPIDEKNNNAPSVDTPSSSDVVKVKKVKKKIASTLLSFGDEEEVTEESLSRATTGNSTSYSKEALEELRKSTLSTTPSSRSYDSMGEKSAEEKFPTFLGGRSNFIAWPTIIPDAQAIHLIKKKREQMRLRNDRDEEEFILLAGGDDNTFVEEKNTRLIREEDDDMDDGEADLENVLGEKLELGSKAERQAQRIKRNARKELIENMDEDEEDEEETREWEMQQIRNAGIDKRERKKARSTPVQKGVAYQIRREEAGVVLRTIESDDAMTKASGRYSFFSRIVFIL